SRPGFGAFAPRLLVHADLLLRRQSDRNVCHVLSRATQPEPARAGDNQAHYISRGRGHSTQAGGKGPPRERSLSGGSTTPQPYRELGMDTCFRRNQVLVRGNLSRAWFRSGCRAAAIRNILSAPLFGGPGKSEGTVRKRHSGKRGIRKR